MTHRRTIEVVVLCEGRDDFSLIQKFLRAMDANRKPKNKTFRVIRPIFPLGGAQSAEQFVRENAGLEVLRLRKKHRARALIIHSDADMLTTSQRHSSIESQIAPERKKSEPISIIVPRRSTETWIRYLCGQQVDEDAEVREPKRNKGVGTSSKDLAQAAKHLAEIARNNWQFPPNPPPSLVAAREEFQRVLT